MGSGCFSMQKGLGAGAHPEIFEGGGDTGGRGRLLRLVGGGGRLVRVGGRGGGKEG
jgi:hypothetical protein